MRCSTCNGTGEVPKKAWAQPPNQPDVHPAIMARAPAYRTIVRVTCPDCRGTGGTHVDPVRHALLMSRGTPGRRR